MNAMRTLALAPSHSHAVHASLSHSHAVHASFPHSHAVHASFPPRGVVPTQARGRKPVSWQQRDSLREEGWCG